MTIFKKIVEKQIPAEIVYEDELCLAFKDINPQAPIHVLIIPKQEIARHSLVKPEHAALLGHLMVKAAEIAKKLGLSESGYRLVINDGEQAGQTVFHIHLHLLGGRPMRWPPG
jgi:histidine triad (HIT) family protein